MLACFVSLFESGRKDAALKCFFLEILGGKENTERSFCLDVHCTAEHNGGGRGNTKEIRECEMSQ